MGFQKLKTFATKLSPMKVYCGDSRRNIQFQWRPFLAILLQGLLPTVSEDHRCGVTAAKASVKLMLYYANPSSYSKFYDLLGYVIMTLFVALGEEVLVCELLEDLIFVVTVAEDRESGCGMMQTVNEELVSKLLLVLIDMLVDIDADPNWGNATSDDENEGEFSSCGYAMESLDRLAIALGGNVIVLSCPLSLFNFLHNEVWEIRHAAVTAIGLISEGCSKVIVVSSKDMEQLVETIVKLIHDEHPRRGMTMMKEAALETLASLAISSQEDSAYIFDSIMPYLKVILLTATKDASRMLLAKSLECLTMITVAVGNLAILDYVEKTMQILRADFIPYLSVSMPIVLKSATLKNYLSVPNDSDTDDSDDESTIKVAAGNKNIGIRSALVEEKALACHMRCYFAAELKEGMHLWVNEVVSALVPNLTFKYSAEVRMAAIPAMPLLLNSAACAMTNRFPVTGFGKSPVQKLSDTIITALLDALKKIGICLGTLVKKLKASFLPLFDKFFPYVSLMYYEEWIPLLPRVYYHKNPDVPQIVATAIGIYLKFTNV
ncbi:hypothetical protein RND71_022264 [Anisodus tanguticus]|uniref:Uncharacterized protein n=1 Tax=Anisodus tanguticus TaxID=243964 RepID=A0AAE1RY80_9SOLA|nr:hypothetical protein RND71_022264 [Anisodus tanguticus]